MNNTEQLYIQLLKQDYLYILSFVHVFRDRLVYILPGKQVVRCSIKASCVTCFRAAFIDEMAKQRISPSGINCD